MSRPDLKKKLANDLWVEKYRPDTIDDILLPKKYKRFFKKIIKGGEIPNLLLSSSSPGTGKTTLAKAICYDFGIKPKYINVSSRGGIATLREDIERYAATKSLERKIKVVIMDEFDGASISLQQGLRAALEEFKNSCRFIFTCNYQTKIIEPLKSRCQIFNFDLADRENVNEMVPQIVNRICGILQINEISFQKKTIEKLVDTYYPDIRKMLGLCQQYSNMAGSIDENIFNFNKIDEEFYIYILERKFGKARTYLIETNYNYSELYRELYDNLIPKIKNPQARAQVILAISEYMYRHAFAIDPEINAAACLLEIMDNLKGE